MPKIESLETKPQWLFHGEQFHIVSDSIWPAIIKVLKAADLVVDTAGHPDYVDELRDARNELEDL